MTTDPDELREKAPRHGDAVVRYVREGGHMGGFLNAVFSNDLVAACGRADSTNEELLGEWATFLYNYVPGDCWGSREKVEEWREAGGIEGKRMENDL